MLLEHSSKYCRESPLKVAVFILQVLCGFKIKCLLSCFQNRPNLVYFNAAPEEDYRLLFL